jgi:hypothetical protein
VELRYKHVEAALAAVCQVPRKGMGAFRARLRHLRNIGLPRLPTPGSGQRIAYSPRQALEMLLALEIENAGHSPQNAAWIVPSIVRQSPYGQHEGKDCYIVMTDPNSAYTRAFGLEQLTEALETAPALVLIINVSKYVRKVETALERASRAD